MSSRDNLGRGEAIVLLSKIPVSPQFLPQRCLVCQVWLYGSSLLRSHYSLVHFREELSSLSEAYSSCPECAYCGRDLGIHLGTQHGYYKAYLSKLFSCGVRLDRRPFLNHAASCVVRIDNADILNYLGKRGKEGNMDKEDFKLLIHCQLCGEAFANLYHLLVHLVEELKSTFPSSLAPETPRGLKQCHACQTELPPEALLEHHGVFHQAVIRPYVLQVNKSPRTDNTFFRREGNGFACSLCEASLPSELEALSHIMEEHDPLIYFPLTCLLCDQVVKSNFIVHIMETHFSEDIAGILPEGPPYSCYVCNIICKSQKELTHHFCYIHNMALNLYNNAVNSASKLKIKSTTVKFVYRCWYCEEKRLDFFTNIDDLRSHVIQHHLRHQIEDHIAKETLLFQDDKRRKCSDCNFFAVDTKQLICHCANAHTKYLDHILRERGAEEMLESIPICDPLPPKSKLVREMLFYQNRYHQDLTLRKETTSEELTSHPMSHELSLGVPEEDIAGQSEKMTPCYSSNHGISSVAFNEKIPVNNNNTSYRSNDASSFQEEQEDKVRIMIVKEESPWCPPSFPPNQDELFNRIESNGPSDPATTQPLTESKDSVLNDRNSEHRVHGKEIKLSYRTLNKFAVRNTFCLYCGQYFERSNSLLKHLVSHFYDELLRTLTEMNVSTICPNCPKVFSSKEALLIHYGVSHKRVVTIYFHWIKKNPECIQKYHKQNTVLDSGRVMEEVGNKENKAISMGSGSPFGSMMFEESAKISAVMKAYLNGESTSSGSSFIQPGACFYISPLLPHCHECESYVQGGMDGVFSSCCQFEGFRKLSIVKQKIVSSGWLDPIEDPKPEDKSLWTPVTDHMSNPCPSPDVCKFIIKYVGSEFCELIREEMEAQKKYPSNRIWKRMQEGVREMCDVCSTTLFNTHYTCGDCGILVCIDCFSVRSRGTVEYFGSNVLSKPYKSHRKILTKNRDEHMWPLCKENARHKVSGLLCTQIICHGLMENLYEEFHSVCDQLGIRNCCEPSPSSSPPSQRDLRDETEPMNENFTFPVNRPLNSIKIETDIKIENEVLYSENDQANELLLLELETKESLQNGTEHGKELLNSETEVGLLEGNGIEMKRVEEMIKKDSSMENSRGESSDVSHRQCPICFTSFPSIIPTLGYFHLTRHFEDEIRSLLDKENRTSCPMCPQIFEKEDLVILHLGIEHGITNEKLNKWNKKRSLKVQLNVDSATSCIVCGMNFLHHMMGFPQIRLHLFSHFRDIIRSRFKLESYCPICPPVDPSKEPPRTKSSLTQHIGIHHRYLDICWMEHSNGKPSLEEDSAVKAEVKPVKMYKSVILAFSCEICGLRLLNQSALYKHSALTHFKDDLLHFVSQSSGCLLCTKSNDSSMEDLLIHVAVHHGKIQELLNNEESILSKTPSSEKGIPFCPVCQMDGNYDLSHFSIHMSIPSHQEIIKNDSDLKKFLRKINTFCIICEKKLRPSRLVSHYFTHFRKLFNFRMNGLTCILCQNDLPSFVNFVEVENHFKMEHFLEYVGDYLRPIRSIQDVYKLRESLSSIEEYSLPLSTSTSSSPKRLKRNCDYCLEGYVQGAYYEHMSLQHFQEVLQVGMPENPPFECDRCSFVGSCLQDLVVHSADYHKNLDRILNQICTSFNKMEEDSGENSRLDLRTFKSTQHLSEKTRIFTCKKCNFMTMKEASLNTHIVQHIRDITRSFIGSFKRPPYICPKCQYEASSYISLLRHFCTSHSHLLDQDVNESSSGPSLTNQPQNGVGEPSKSHLQVSVTYKDNGVAAHSQLSPIKVSKKLDFSSFIKDLAAESSPKASSGMDSCTPLRPPRSSGDRMGESREQRVMTKGLSSRLYPEVDHDWFCDGRLLFLNDPSCSRNKELFQEQWKRGQPVLVSNCSRGLSNKFWHPRAFLEDFGHLRHDLVNCFTSKVVPKAPLNEFWKGFERVEERLRDSSGNPMLLKLKDWPPTLDIADYIPKRFKEFINSLIFPEYTQREGYLNLASYIPKFFLRPELGPKMYIAYGSALYSDKGSTNLHIDMSDAVNLLVYVGLPEDADAMENAKEVFKEIDEADCDVLMKWKVRNGGQQPGALWHIYHPSDTNKIRSFLNKVALEKGKRLDPHDDPIHDQSHYLDGPLRLRLYEEYGVKGYGIVQCAGDTVFIPAGACHQVRNLNNCIKIAEDFVSPENTSHCLHLTQEFRHLTEFHTNHEDKLQIKNLMYHSIKAAVTVLKDHCKEEEETSFKTQRDDAI